MSMFGEGLCASHHGSCSLLQLAQFLPSLIQSYPGAGQISHNPRCRTLHALHVAGTRDVLCQASGSLTSSCFTNYQRQERKSMG